MKDTMTYKGYTGSVHCSYEGKDVESLRRAFKEAVDYLALGKKEGRKPDQPFSGTFNVRTGSDLHRRAVFLAKEQGTTLNRVVSEALQRTSGKKITRANGLRPNKT
jgi:predicted HicB family RNase H-like nuclease